MLEIRDLVLAPQPSSARLTLREYLTLASNNAKITREMAEFWGFPTALTPTFRPEAICIQLLTGGLSRDTVWTHLRDRFAARVIFASLSAFTRVLRSR
jgi:hypothetical protein